MPLQSTFGAGSVRAYRGSRIGVGSLIVSYSVVGGGGGAGSGLENYYFAMGPGGGGGLLQGTSFPLLKMAYIIVGAGGVGSTSATTSILSGFGNSGSNSLIYNGYGANIVAIGGGGSGKNGGSGGGVFGDGTVYPRGLGTSGQGNNGGFCTQSIQFDWGCGGGGGAGAAGANASSSGGGGGGGNGLACSSTDGVVRGGGGGGFYLNTSGVWVAAAGGTGGGTAGTVNGTAPANGTANTGGGAGNRLDGVPGANGGSGIVILQYASAGSVVLARGGTVTIPVAGTVRHTFTTSGIFALIN